MPAREVLEVDVLFVGGGPAGLSGALHLQQLLARHDALAKETGGKPLGEIMVAVVEKAETLGAHAISGAVVDPRALDELLPDWREQSPPLVPVESDELKWFTAGRAISLPHPPWMRNTGCWTGSLNSLVRWLGQKAEAAGVNLFAGFPAADLIVEDGAVRGVALEAALAAGVPLAEHDVRREALRTVREIVATNAVRGARAIIVLDGAPVADGRPGPLAAALAAALEQG